MRVDTSELRLVDVGKRFGARWAVRHLTWQPAAGTVTALVGLNGAGKSTLMRVACGLVRASEGHVRPAVVAAGGRGVSAMIEAPALFNALSVEQNVRVHQRLTGVADSEVRRMLDVGRLRDVRTRRAGTLSQGYRQRTALAIALLGHPRVVLLDEPTNALDPESIAHLRQVVADTAAEGAAVVVSSHLLRELEGLAGALTLLSQGRIVYDGSFDGFVGPGRLRVRTADPGDLDRLRERVGAHGVIEHGSTGPLLAVPVPEGHDEHGADRLSHAVGIAAAEERIALVELAHHRASLEDRFAELTTPAPTDTDLEER